MTTRCLPLSTCGRVCIVSSRFPGANFRVPFPLVAIPRRAEPPVASPAMRRGNADEIASIEQNSPIIEHKPAKAQLIASTMVPGGRVRLTVPVGTVGTRRDSIGEPGEGPRAPRRLRQAGRNRRTRTTQRSKPRQAPETCFEGRSCSERRQLKCRRLTEGRLLQFACMRKQLTTRFRSLHSSLPLGRFQSPAFPPH